MVGPRERIGDRYVLEQEVGAGGMGVVWRARDERLGRPVALKLLTAAAVGSEVARARMMREARAAAKLQHDGIVHVYDVGETADGGAFLVMELVTGRSLRDRAGEADFTIGERIAIVIEVARALGYAHASGVVHRDVKPDNVLLRDNGRPVVLDFGLAKPVTTELSDTVGASADSLRLTGTGNIVGTPAYLAPEQVKGDDVGPHADQFALAVMTFELVTGKLPWKGKAVLEVLTSMLHDDPPSAEAIAPELPAGVDDVLRRGMKRVPGDRYPDIGAFADALANACGDLVTSSGRGGGARSPSGHGERGRRSVPSSSNPTAGRSPTTSGDGALAKEVLPAHPRRRHRLAAIGAVTALVVAVVGIGRTLTSKQRAPAEAASRVTGLGPNSVVACPHFKIVGDVLEPKSGWLGAAAASLACDRVQAALGGASSRTLTPAELLPGIPREPIDMVALDAFSADGADAQATKAAKERGSAWVEGTLTRKPDGFVADIVLRAKDDREIARGSGHGYEVFEAVSGAVREAKSGFSDPSTSDFQKEWLRVESVDAALDLVDLTSAVLSEDDIVLASICERVQRQRGLKPDMAYLVRALCHERLKRGPLDEPPPAIDASSPGAFVTTIAAHRSRGGPEETKKRALRLREMGDNAKTPDERAIVAVTGAELFYAVGDLEGARSWARMAVQAQPKLSDPRGTPWHRLAFASEFDRGLSPVHAYWLPWEPVALENAGSHAATYPEKVRLFGRAYLLARRGFFASAFGEGLAHLGKTEQSRNIAELLDNDYLRARTLIGEQKYRAALNFVVAATGKLEAEGATAGRAFRLGSAGVEAAETIGAPADFVDDIVKRWIDPEPPVATKVGVVSFMALLHTCGRAPAPTARRCIRRLRELYARGDLGGIMGTAPSVLEGVELFLNKDYKAAAKAFRPTLRQGGAITGGGLRHIIADTFDRAGLLDLAERSDADFAALADTPGAMDLAIVRSAFRAEKQGALARSRKLATICIERFSLADDDPAALKELGALVKRLPPE